MYPGTGRSNRAARLSTDERLEIFMGLFSRMQPTMVTPEEALAGRDEAIPVAAAHLITGNPMLPPYPESFGQIDLAMGCFWGAERIFWQAPGVWTTAVGYAGGFTKNPTYQEVCSGRTGHTEVVRAVFDPELTSFDEMLQLFWESHDPTQGMRQGNDVGTQYRSAVYWRTEAERSAIEASARRFQPALESAGYGPITSDIAAAGPFYFAEDYHQQYLAKNPNGYCGIGGTGVSCPVGVVSAD